MRWGEKFLKVCLLLDFLYKVAMELTFEELSKVEMRWEEHFSKVSSLLDFAYKVTIELSFEKFYQRCVWQKGTPRKIWCHF